MSALKVLHTRRLTLEPLEESHAPALFPGLQHEALYEYIGERAPEGVAALRERYRRLATRVSTDGQEAWLNWALRSSTDGYVGTVQATVRPDSSAQIAYVLFREAWGHGYAREAVAALIDHLRDDWQVRSIGATVDTCNRRSIALLESLGFSRGEVRIGAEEIRGVLADEVEYSLPSLARDEFELQPTLRGSRLELRPLTRDDFDSVFRAASDPLIWEQHPEPNRHERAAFERYFDGAIESRGAFAVVEIGTGRIIGCTRFCNLDLDASEVEIGWTFLERAFWGGAHNREMKTLLLGHAFRYVRRVVFVVGEHNLRSQRALEKIGAVASRRGERRMLDGRMTSTVVFAITRPS